MTYNAAVCILFYFYRINDIHKTCKNEKQIVKKEKKKEKILFQNWLFDTVQSTAMEN